jgi:recombination protein RecA
MRRTGAAQTANVLPARADEIDTAQSLLVAPEPARNVLGRLEVRGVRLGLRAEQTPTDWRLPTFAGRFAEISGDRSGAALTVAFRLVYDAQRRQEPVAWIGRRHSVFFPPDAERTGIDLGALAVIWAPETLRAARAADHLLRSGGFGLVVLDVGTEDHLPIPVQTRLVGLAHRHDAALICITDKKSGNPSIGSLVSLRVQTERGDPVGNRYRCTVRVLKDKRRGPGWTHEEVYRGPDGLC